MAPFESTFIVFRHKSDKKATSYNPETNYPAPQLVADLSRDWTVTFDPLRGGPSEPVRFDSLKDWTTFSDNDIKYYSGTAIYKNHFTIDSLSGHHEITIDLGKLTAMGKVYINDIYAGGVWTPPIPAEDNAVLKERDKRHKD